MTKRVRRLIKGLGLDKAGEGRLVVSICSGSANEMEEIESIQATDYTIDDFKKAFEKVKERSRVESVSSYDKLDHSEMCAYLKDPEGEDDQSADHGLDFASCDFANGKEVKEYKSWIQTHGSKEINDFFR
jgi:hypothetical protein